MAKYKIQVEPQEEDNFHLFGYRQDAENPETVDPALKRRRAALQDGTPDQAAAEVLTLAKDTVLGSGGTAMTFLLLETPQGQVMIGPRFGQPIPELARSAAVHAREAKATRVTSSGALWFHPRDMPLPRFGAQWRKVYRRRRKPGLMGFCVDVAKGVGSAAVIGYTNAAGKPVGFGPVPADYVPEAEPAIVYQFIIAGMTGQPIPKMKALRIE